MTESLVVEEGRVLVYRIFDVADEIDLIEAGRLWRARARGGHRPRLAREKGQGLLFATPPLDIALGPGTVDLPAPHPRCEGELSARLFDYGAVSVRFELPIAAGTDLEALLPLCDYLYDAPEMDAAARAAFGAVLPTIASALSGAHDFSGVETYTVIFVKTLRGAPKAREVLASPVLPKLLLGEASATPLSDEEQSDVIRHAQSYFENDLAVVDWNSAFVLELSGSRDIPDVLEFANTQLLELRYYDTLLDVELRQIYDDFAQARRRTTSLLWSPYGKLARNVLRRVLEVNEFAERVDNALKVSGDFYLARVYQATVRRLRIPAWQGSVDRKQKLVAQAYDLLKGEVEIRRSTTLEIIVVLLILVELLAALRGR